jgi:Na+/H+-dicarboxylate symporter
MYFARAFGVDLTLASLATFMGSMFLMSFTTAGIPRGGGQFRYLPFYLAAGLPVEAVVIIAAAKTIPDILMTILNSTAYMTAAVLLSRGHRKASG